MEKDSMDTAGLKPIVESLIFASDEAISIDRLAAIIEGAERAEIREAVSSLVDEYADRGGGIVLEEVAGGFRFRTVPESAPWLRRLFKIGGQRISKAAMETLSIIAYKQPVTRGEVEAVRGVDSGGVLATLMDKRFIKIVGRKETPGRPVVYATTKEFLETFDLKDLSCLPTLKDIQRMEEADEEAAEGFEAGFEGRPEGTDGAEGGEGAGEDGAGVEVAEGPGDDAVGPGEEGFVEEGPVDRAEDPDSDVGLDERPGGDEEPRSAGTAGGDYGAEDGYSEEEDDPDFACAGEGDEEPCSAGTADGNYGAEGGYSEEEDAPDFACAGEGDEEYDAEDDDTYEESDPEEDRG